MSESLVDQIRQGHRRALARLITQLENEQPQAQTTLSQLFSSSGQAHLVGITGAPGTGKSTLVAALASRYRRQGHTVAIVAVDPTSPFSGGAILGDRIRMQGLAGDPGVFIRSLANRGHLGGLSRTTQDVVTVLDAAGFDLVLIETVGAGQSEVEIARTAQTVIVVDAPGLGDDIQAIKAGILEIADIFVVNKADRPNAERTVASLKAMLELGPAHQPSAWHHGQSLPLNLPTQSSPNTPWKIPVCKTVAHQGAGVAEVVSAITQHRAYLIASGLLAQRDQARLQADLEARLQTALLAQLQAHLPADYLADIMEKLVNRTVAPYNAVQSILDTYMQQVLKC